MELSVKEYSGDAYVPDPHRKEFISVTELPNPDLNPLLNPTLGRNLGRWAEVYFTTPPEKRAEAVEELLRELEGSPRTESLNASALTPEPMSPRLPLENPVAANTCPDCGQEYEATQRFCGMCGASLLGSASPLDTQPLAHAMPGETGPEMPPLQFSVPRSLASFDAVAGDRESTADEASEIRWLREKQLGIADSALGAPSSFLRRFATVALAMLAIGGLVYLQSRPRRAPTPPSGSISQISQERTSAGGHGASAASPETRASLAQPSQAQTGASGNLSGQAAESSTQAALPRVSKEPTKPQPAPVTPPVKPAPPVTSTVDSGNGSIEVAQAEEYLNGKNGGRDATMAARLLWIAVGKENTSAIVLLSNMYMIGDGVPKSCDQAKVLLYAAARKHVVQAADKLRNLEQSGCP